MAYDPNNIFARILRQELPCVRVYEDQHTLAFMDLMPQTDGHVLVIPKEPAVTLLDLSRAGTVACLDTVRYLAPAVIAAAGADGMTMSQVNGAGQTVPHVHFHLIPRKLGVEMRAHAAIRAEIAELEARAAAIRALLPPR